MIQNPSKVKGFDFFFSFFTIQRKVYHTSVRAIILFIVIIVILVVVEGLNSLVWV